MHIADLAKGMLGANGIVGGGPPLVCGAALTAEYLKTGGVAVAFVGDGGSNQGTTLESYNLAKVWQLPVIFVVEDNGYAESTASAWSVGGSQVGRAAGFGMPGMKSTDTTSSPSTTPRARRSNAPGTEAGRALMHVATVPLLRPFRRRRHDVSGGRRSRQTAAREATALKLFRKPRRLRQDFSITARLDAIDDEVAKLIDEAVVAAEAAAMPSEADLATDVYLRY